MITQHTNTQQPVTHFLHKPPKQFRKVFRTRIIYFLNFVNQTFHLGKYWKMTLARKKLWSHKEMRKELNSLATFEKRFWGGGDGESISVPTVQPDGSAWSVIEQQVCLNFHPLLCNFCLQETTLVPSLQFQLSWSDENAIWWRSLDLDTNSQT